MALRMAIRAVPDHEGSRAALGEVFFEGRWMPLAEALERRGLVRHGALWVTPEEKAALVWKERVRACAVEVRRLGARVRSPEPATRAEAERLMGALDDPAALDPLLEASGHWHASVRRASLPALARRAAEEEAKVARRLAALAAGDPELDVQDRAADLVRERRLARGADELLRLYVDAEAASTRRAAAHALGRIRWKAAFEPLFATLTFRVRRERMIPVPYWTPTVLPVSPHAAEAWGIRRRLVNGYRLQPYEIRVVDDIAWNDAARTGLRGITGVDFHFDATGWWNWWVDRAAGFGPWMEPAAPPGGAGAARPAAGPGA
jgi:hypothetical protein